MMSIRVLLPQSHQHICFSHNDILDLTTSCRFTIFTISFELGLASADGQRLECFKSTANNILIRTLKIQKTHFVVKLCRNFNSPELSLGVYVYVSLSLFLSAHAILEYWTRQMRPQENWAPLFQPNVFISIPQKSGPTTLKLFTATLQ